MNEATLYIDGCWVRPSRPNRLSSINPATEMTLQEVSAAGIEEVDLAVQAARRAFEGEWGHTRGAVRARFLEAMADDLERRAEELALLEVLDNGKPLPEARQDVAEAIACFRYYAGLACELDERQEQPLALDDPRFSCRIRHEPVGVAALIVPWNFPLLMAARKVAPALAAGATCVLKPSELTPLTALQLGHAAHAVGLPPGVLNIVPGRGYETGQALAQHPEVDKLAFSGRLITGARLVADTAADFNNPTLELGGKSSLIVFDDADLDAAVEWALYGIFRNQGQAGSATSRLLVQQGIAERLLERLVEAVRDICIGPGTEPGVQMGPLVSAARYSQVMEVIAQGRQDARLLTGGRRPPGLHIGYFIEPTVFDEPHTGSPLWRHEILGPVLSVKRFGTEEQAVAMANDSLYGFAAAVMSTDLDRARRVAGQLRVGVAWINCSQPALVQAPWGGTRLSGLGRELGPWGLDNYLEVKQVTEYISEEPWGWYGR